MRRTILNFSMKFPGHHPKSGQPTRFVSKIWKYLQDHNHDINLYGHRILDEESEYFESHHEILAPKIGTLRRNAGNVYHDKDFMTLRTPLKPGLYSESVILAKNVPITISTVHIVNKNSIVIDGRVLNEHELMQFAIDDGFDSIDDMFAWFSHYRVENPSFCHIKFDL